MNPELGAALVLDDVINRYLACYNARDIDGMLDCVTEDVVFENISNTGQSMRLDGRDMMRQVAELSGNAFSYRRQRLVNIVSGGSKAAAEIEFEGKAAVDLPNGIKSGETVKVRGASFFEFRGNLLCRHEVGIILAFSDSPTLRDRLSRLFSGAVSQTGNKTGVEATAQNDSKRDVRHQSVFDALAERVQQPSCL
mgnify:CR=1 FL=1